MIPFGVAQTTGKGLRQCAANGQELAGAGGWVRPLHQLSWLAALDGQDLGTARWRLKGRVQSCKRPLQQIDHLVRCPVATASN